MEEETGKKKRMSSFSCKGLFLNLNEEEEKALLAYSKKKHIRPSTLARGLVFQKLDEVTKDGK